MTTKIKLIIIFIIILLFFPNYASAKSTGYSYIIEDYNINIIVNENHTLDVTQTITANFRTAQNGISLKIPLKCNIPKEDGSTFKRSSKISNITVDNTYKEFNKSGYKIIQIGDTNQSNIGKQIYNIKYTYDIGNDNLRGADELYYNLIENQWDTTIKKVSFEIQMPKSFDQSLLSFSIGNKKSESSDLKYYVEDTTIKGNTLTTLTPGQTLTLNLTLPNKYFKTGFNFIFVIFVIILIAILSIVFIILKKRNKNM